MPKPSSLDLKKLIVDITTDHYSDTLEEVMDVYVAKFVAWRDAAIVEKLYELYDMRTLITPAMQIGIFIVEVNDIKKIIIELEVSNE